MVNTLPTNGPHPVSQYVQTISILSDSLYSTHFLLLIDIPPLIRDSSFLTQNICNTPKVKNIDFSSLSTSLTIFTYLDHPITLLLQTFTSNFHISHTLTNSLTSLHKFTPESAALLNDKQSKFMMSQNSLHLHLPFQSSPKHNSIHTQSRYILIKQPQIITQH